ncbi:MAG: hypothetical protein GY790_06155 [Bacteroidetes bacterium]|nr:hypothetical protein [Bacteroidota bacterium]
MKRITSLLLFVCLPLFIIECSREEQVRVMKVETQSVSNISYYSCSVSGQIIDQGDEPSLIYGFCLDELGNPSLESGRVIQVDSKNSQGEFSADISGLICETGYSVKAFARNSKDTVYGIQKDFSTQECISHSEISTSAVSGITYNSAIGGGTITSDGGNAITTRGICWGTSPGPSLSGSFSVEGSGTGSFTSTMNGLNCETLYYVRAYATNALGTVFGEQLSFSTSECPSNLPSLTTSAIGNITENSASAGGNVTSDGGKAITARGVCWSMSQNPSISDAHSSDGEGTGIFNSTLDGLSCKTAYYVRAYASNEAGTAYGDQVFFETSECSVDLATVTTSGITSITQTTALGGGSVSNDGGASITSKGICWSTSSTPSTSDFTTSDGSGSSSFSSVMTSLSCGTTYYVRAYAVNSAGTGYGDQLSFQTTSCPVPPTVSTASISSVTETTATGGGNVSSDGGAQVTDVGVCWGLTHNPTLDDYNTDDGSGVGTFTSSITGLSCSETYYVRAYAINSAGTSFGEEKVLITETCTVTDIDNNVYPTVKLGEQIWMAENLKVTHYSDGTAISLELDDTAWDDLSETERAYCYQEDVVSNLDNYGALYNWAGAMNGSSSSNSNPSGVQGVCPSGWHLPSDSEWMELESYLGMTSTERNKMENWRGTDEGERLKITGTTYWDSPNYATNSTTFSVRGGGFQNTTGIYGNFKRNADIHSSTDSDYSVIFRGFKHDLTGVFRGIYSKTAGFSVRCVKDK